MDLTTCDYCTNGGVYPACASILWPPKAKVMKMGSKSSSKKRKNGPPKYMEKMLFINHKEDQQLQYKLEQLHLKSRDREIEMDLAKNRVEKEWKQNSKKQITISELNNAMGKYNRNGFIPDTATRARARRTSARAAQDLSVNDYLIEEHRKLSSVIPEILTALTIPKNQNSKQLVPDAPLYQQENVTDLDVNKIVKMTHAVKILRKNISTRMKANEHQPPLTVVLRPSRSDGDLNVYTNGACALMKRKIDRKRKQSNSNYELPPSMQRKLAALEKQMSDPRRQSVMASIPDVSKLKSQQKRHSVCVPALQRSQSIAALPPIPTTPGMLRSLTNVSMNSGLDHRRKNSSEGNSQTIDEDELRSRQKIAMEMERYDAVRNKITNFLDNKIRQIDSNMYIDAR
ncbi:uncharacterized protein LOC134687379 isoform X1 [Mytilus trossulus]|uniref:uncharacterized protein LOC134687379 isoform X1 n=2 Tax=Mytilus trossulus TaxID=6551 RepID=UPI003004996D